jgi:hypothetical protein
MYTLSLLLPLYPLFFGGNSLLYAMMDPESSIQYHLYRVINSPLTTLDEKYKKWSSVYTNDMRRCDMRILV